MTSKVVLGHLREAPKAAPEPIGSQMGIETKKKPQKVSFYPPQAFDLNFDQNPKVIEQVCLKVTFFHVIFRMAFYTNLYPM